MKKIASAYKRGDQWIVSSWSDYHDDYVLSQGMDFQKARTMVKELNEKYKLELQHE